MKKIIQTSFVICFLLVLAIPFIRFNRYETISEIENRNLANRPFLLTDNRINKNFFSECSTYFDDRFGGRSYLLKINQKINRKIYSKTLMHNEHVLQGKKGWWFYINGNNLQDFYKKNLMNDEEIDSWKKNIQNAADWCENHGIKTVFLICPNKHSVYSEYYPFPRPKGGFTRADQFVKILNELGVEYVFPRDVLIQEKKNYNYPLYFETGTHWNQQGALITAELIENIIEKDFPELVFPKIEWMTKEISYNTYDSMLGMINLPLSNNTYVSIIPKDGDFTNYYTYEKNMGANGVHTLGKNHDLPRAIVYRDSFFSDLEPFLSPLFSEAEYQWKHFNIDEEKKYILDFKPDIIIFETLERFAEDLIY